MRVVLAVVLLGAFVGALVGTVVSFAVGAWLSWDLDRMEQRMMKKQEERNE